MQIKTTAFSSGGAIPREYTCDGKDLIPPLQFFGVPEGVKSFALIIDDPDATFAGVWDHHLVWNIPPEIREIQEGILPPGVSGKNSWGELGYKGPCPPKEHRYFFKLFALDRFLDLPEGSTKKELIDSLQGHILDEAEIFGTYQRK